MSKDDWIPVNGTPPRDRQRCLVTVEYFGSKKSRCVRIGTYSKDLYEIDEYDFYDKKGKAGWYYCDSEYGYCEIFGIRAWKPLDEPYMGD